MTLGLSALMGTGVAGATATELLGTANALTATAGGTQSASATLTAAINRFTTVASNQDGCKLPWAQPGAEVIIINSAAVNALQVFGQSGDTINGVATATGVSQQAGVAALYFCPVVGLWFRLLSL